jgi:hypothetical protein
MRERLRLSRPQTSVYEPFEREIAIYALNSINVLYTVVLNGACSYTNYYLYNTGKHALCATMYTTHQDHLGMLTRVFSPKATVQVVHVELGGPLIPFQMPRFRQFDQVQCFDFNYFN